MHAPVQAKLLRALESGEVRRVGAVAATDVRCRLVLAIQEEPGALRRSGRWRDDFYYRVTGIVLQVPPLAERASDIPLLARAFVRGRGLPHIEPAAMHLLQCHGWPGNVRELQRALDRGAHHSRNGTIAADAVQAALAEADGAPPEEAHSLLQAKSRHARHTVDACGGDTRQAAALLGVSRSHLYRLLHGRNSGSVAGAHSPRG